MADPRAAMCFIGMESEQWGVEAIQVMRRHSCEAERRSPMTTTYCTALVDGLKVFYLL